MKIGYGRVSTTDQSTEIQKEQLSKIGCERIFLEQASGKDANRPELQRMLDSLRSGDEVHVIKLDRLARNMQDALALVKQIRDSGCTIQFHDIDIDFNNEMGELVVAIMAWVAQFERGRMLDRQKAGIEKAKNEGKHLGRPKEVNTKKIMKYLNDGMNQTQVAKVMGISRTTVRRAIKETEESQC